MTQLPSTHPDAQNEDAISESHQVDGLLNDTDSDPNAVPMPENSQLWQQTYTKTSPGLLKAGEMLKEPTLVFPENPVGLDPKMAQVQRPQQWREGRWGKLPIRQKVIAIAAALGFAPTLVLGFISYNVQRGALIQAVETEVLASGGAISDQLSLFMRERYGDIQIIAQTSVLSKETERASTSLAEKSKALNQFLTAYPIYNSIAAFDLNGDLLGQSSGKTVGNHGDRSYFQAAKNSGQPFLSQPIVSKSTGEASIYVAAPIRDEATQEMVGIVRARIPVTVIDNLLQEASVANRSDSKQQWSYDLYSADDSLFSTSRLSQDEGSNSKILDKAAQLGVATELKNHRTQTIARADTETGLTTVTPDTIVSLVPFRSYSDAFRAELPPLNWKTVTTLDRKQLNSQQQQLAFGLLAQALLAGGILSVVAALLASRATRPILAAVDAVQRIGQGDLDVRLSVKGEDEIATLGSNLNQLTEQLKAFKQEQENAVLRSDWLSTIAIGADAMTDAELEESFCQVVAEARRLMAVDRVLIYRLTHEGQLTVAQESVQGDWPAALHVDLSGVRLPQRFVEAFQMRQSVAIADVTTESDLSESYQQLLASLEVKAELVVPMVDNDQLSGLLVAQSCQQNRDWQDTDTAFLQQLVAQIGVAQQIQEVQTARGVAEMSAQEAQERTEELQRRVLQLLMEVDPVSQGDLTIRAKVTEDEIGTVADSYNATIESLRKIVAQVKEAVTQVANTALSSQSSVTELSIGANQQTDEISQALAQIQQMADSIRLVANNAIQAEAAVQQAAQTVKAGDAAMDQTVEGIFGLRETVGEAAKKVKRLGESSQKISKVVNLIGSFAEQTNLLALNASIEAAHAGEEGRGFAVVADEVRSLARQSAAATAEIEALVAEIQAETNQVSAAMESGTEQVVAGTQLVENARHNLTQISAVSEQINELVEAIAQATHQQTEASEQVSKVMTDVANIAQQTSGSVGNVSNSFQNLVNIAQSLEESVGRFKVS